MLNPRCIFAAGIVFYKFTKKLSKNYAQCYNLSFFKMERNTNF